MNKNIGPYLWLLGGVALVVIGAWLLWDGLAMRNWPSAAAESLESSVVSRHETRRRASTTYHDIVVMLKFQANGRQVVASTTAESYLDNGPAQFWASKRYSAGTRHTIWFDPADPSRVQLQAPDLQSALVPSVPVILVGALIVGFITLGGRPF